MNRLITTAVLILTGLSFSNAQTFDDRPAWTYNVDFKDKDLYGPFFGYDFVGKSSKAGLAWAPLSIYRVAGGFAERFFHAGFMLLTDGGKLNASFGPTAGIDLPLGWENAKFTIDAFGGITPIHTLDVRSVSGGVGARFTKKLGQAATKKGR